MASDSVGLAAFSVLVAFLVLWMARRDLLFAGFLFFFFVYTIFAMVGYLFFPILPWTLRLYFGPEVFAPYLRFVTLSFVAFAGVFALLHRYVVRTDRFVVDAEPRTVLKTLYLGGMTFYMLWLALVFARDYDRIGYANDPQIPDLPFAIGFKIMIVPLFVTYAVARKYATTRLEAGVLGTVFGAGLFLFLKIAARVGNRTDILALTMAIAMFELYPHATTHAGGLRFRLKLSARTLRRVAGTALLAVAAIVVMLRIERQRTGNSYGLPAYAAVLYNDYFTPAYMLFASIHFDYVRPGEVFRSNLFNAFFLGRPVDAPYLQQNVGNLAAPGSSSRSASFGYYIFTEGYMALGQWGFLYNGLVPFLAIALWRLLSSTTDRRANAFGAGLAAMFLANFSRSQSMLAFRALYFYAVPAVILLYMAGGVRLRRAVRNTAAAP